MKNNKTLILLTLFVFIVGMAFASGQYYGKKVVDNAPIKNAPEKEIVRTPITNPVTNEIPEARLSAKKGITFEVTGDRDTEVVISVDCDYYSSECSWNLWVDNTSSYYYDPDNTFSAGYETQVDTLTLADGVYSVDCFDSYGDGGIGGSVTSGGETLVEWTAYDYSSYGSFGFALGDDPTIDVNYSAWDAGAVLIGSSASTAAFSISNIGGGTLEITGITDLAGTEFTTDFVIADANIALAAGSYDFGFTYSPIDDAADNVTFTIVSTGGNFDITLDGVGYAPFTTGWYDGFEDGASDGWTIVDNDANGYTWGVSTYGGNAYEGDYYMACGYNSAGNDDWLISPALDIAADDLFKFWVTNNSSYSTEEVYVMLSTTGGTTPADFDVQLDFLELCEYYTWLQKEYDLTAYAGTTVTVALNIVSIDQYYTYADYFELVEAPSEPEISINYTGVDHGAVFVGDTSSYGDVFEISNVGGGTLTVNAITDLSATDYTTTFDVAGANVALATGSYLFGFTYAPSDIGADDVTFTIESDGGNVDVALAGIGLGADYVNEGFEAAFPPTGWEANIVSGTYNWEQSDYWGSFDPEGTGSYTALYNTYYASTGSTAEMITPRLDFTGSASNYLAFLYVGTGDLLDIDITDDGGTTWYDVADITDNTGGYVTPYSYDLSAYTGDNIYLKFTAVSAYQYRMAVDEVKFPPLYVAADATIALSPTSIDFGMLEVDATTSADVTITNTGGQDLVVTDVVVDAPFYCTYTGTIAPGASDVATVTYEPTSPITSSATLTVVSNAVLAGTENEVALTGSAYPAGMWIESFEDGVIPDNWTVINNDGDSYEWEAYATTSAYDGDYLARAHYNASGCDDWLITPPVVPGAGLEGLLKFYAKSYSSSWSEDMNVYVSTTGTDIADFTLLDSYTALGTDWTQYTVNLLPYMGEVVYVAVQCPSVDAYYLWADYFLLPEAYVPPVGTLAGIVTDTDSVAVQGVTCTVGDLVDDSGHQGDYTIEDITIGEYTVTFAKDGYQGASFTVIIEEGVTTTQDVQLIPLGDGTVTYTTDFETGDDLGYVTDYGTAPFEISTGFTYVFDPSSREISGTITCNTNYISGSTMDLWFTLELESPDWEYADYVELTFPTFFTPTAASADINGAALNAIAGQVVSWGIDSPSGWGPIPPGTYTFYVTVDIGGIAGAHTLDYYVAGDGYGSEPHTFTGTCDIEESAAVTVTVAPYSGDQFYVCTPDPAGYPEGVYTIWKSYEEGIYLDLTNYTEAYVNLKVWSMMHEDEDVYFTIGNETTYPSNYIQDYSLDGGATWTEVEIGDCNLGDTEGWVDVMLDVSWICGEVHGQDVKVGMFFIDDTVTPNTTGPDGFGFGLAFDSYELTAYGDYLGTPQNFTLTSGLQGYVPLDWSHPETKTFAHTPNYAITDEGVITEVDITSNRDYYGYNVYRDGAFYVNTIVSEYDDYGVVDYTAYDYYVTALHYEGESLPTETLTGVPGLVGYFDGTVTDGTDPIEEAVITAVSDTYGEFTTTTAADGTYLLEVVPDTYDVTCEAWPYVYYYIAETVEDETVASQETVTIDFALDRFVNPPQNLAAAGGAVDVALDWDPPTEMLGEIAYDTGDLYWILMASYTAGADDYVAVRFDVPLETPYYITDMAGGMYGAHTAYGSEDSTFAFWGLYADLDGVPDLTAPVFNIDSYEVDPAIGPWYYEEVDTEVTSSTVWMVWHWYEGSYYGPWVRSPDDVNTGNSYNGDGTTWTNSWPTHNLAGRIYVSQSAGKGPELAVVGGNDFIGIPTALNNNVDKKTGMIEPIQTFDSVEELGTLSYGNSARIIDTNWNRAVTSYDVYRGTESGVYDGTPIGTTDIPHSSYSDYAPGDGTYYYAVKAIWDEGESAFSNEAWATVMAAYDVPWNTHFTSEGYFTELDDAGDWAFGEPTDISPDAYSTPNVWGTVLDGQYTNTQNAWLVTQPFDLSALNATVSFANWYDVEEGYDYCYFGIDHNADASYDILGIYNGASGAWVVEEYALADSFCTDYAKFAFIFQSDASVTGTGWYIDDFAITLGQPAISISPTTIDETVLTDETSTDIFTIGNSGDGDLSFTIAVDNYGGDETVEEALYEDFEDLDYTGWTTYDYSGNGVGFYYGSHDPAGEYCFGFNSYYYADDYTQWLITPLVTVEAGDEFAFWYQDMYGYGEDFGAYVLDTNDPETATITELGTVSTSSSDWTEFTAALDDFAGQDVYLGIKYFSNYMYYLLIDEISGPAGTAAPVGWLSVDPDAGDVAVGALPTTITATYDATGLEVGTYTADIVVSSNDADSPHTVDVTLTVTGATPIIDVSPTTLTAGENDSQDFYIYNIGNETSTLNFGDITFEYTTPTLSSGGSSSEQSEIKIGGSRAHPVYAYVFNYVYRDETWLDVAPLSGTVAYGDSATITATFDISSLPVGTYTAEITIPSDGGADVIVDVTLDVTVIAASPDSVNFQAYLTKHPDDIQTENDGGCGYGFVGANPPNYPGLLVVVMQNFAYGDWAVGDTIHIDVVDPATGETGWGEYVTTSAGFDMMDDIQLTPFPPDAPTNVTVVFDAGNVTITWDGDPDWPSATYKVYSSDNPYDGFVEDTSGAFAGTSWTAPVSDVKKFYYVTGSN